jgi:AraC family transcriptional regulator, positive regulator of tynA and feaB
MGITISTDSVEPDVRVRYWCDSLRDRLGMEFEVVPGPGHDFRMRMYLLRLGSVSVSEVIGSAHSERRSGNAAAVAAIIPVEGTCTVRCGGFSTAVSPGAAFFVPPTGPTEFHMDADFRLLVVGIPQDLLSTAFPDWKRRMAMPVPTDCGAPAIFSEVVDSVLRHGGGLENSVLAALSGSVLGLAAATLASLQSGDLNVTRLEEYHIARIRQFITANLRNPDLDVCSIARGVGLSTRYVHKLFSLDSCHVMQWVWTRRLDHCYHDLLNDVPGRRSISEIAYSWGFNDQAHFSRAFRRRFGMSPKEARALSAAASQRTPA